MHLSLPQVSYNANVGASGSSASAPSPMGQRRSQANGVTAHVPDNPYSDDVAHTPVVSRRNHGAGTSDYVYSEEPIYGSLYYAKWEEDDRYEANYQYLNEEDLSPPPGIVPPPLPPPNRRRSSAMSSNRSRVSSPDGVGGSTEWLHPAMSREEAEEVLNQDMRSGAFLVREKIPNEQWALSMVWKGMFIHHLVTYSSDTNIFYINGDEFPNPVSSLEDLIDVLRTYQSDSFRVIEQDLRYPIAPKLPFVSSMS